VVGPDGQEVGFISESMDLNEPWITALELRNGA
jgi:hypothetical protein